ncbi:MAG: glycoside hydrolase family 3 C-terminal domain-containing protein [Treponema sp.]|jgi:beta-glucosidase|nr:glycoside hydrolase family 3 C-terminal domain-containing protein [Treponema sp.]
MKCTKEQRLSYTEKAGAIVAQMSLEEKVDLMSGKVNFGPEEIAEMAKDSSRHYNHVPYPNAENRRLGVPSMRFCDGPRGVVCGTGKSTCFPVSMLRGAAFDPALEEEIGRAIGREVRAYGGNLFAGVCINLPHNPGWGRSQESYGEESFAIGQMGAALVRGVQEENVMACVKHYAFNSMEISRFKVSVDCDRRTEREVFLPHFKECVDAGAASVMSAYNLYKGVHCGHHDYLLRKVLKEEWDFDGFVMSDFIWGVKDTAAGANNGEDMEMCATIVYGDKLVKAVKDGLVPEARIDEAALRIVRTVLAFEDAYTADYGEEVIGCDKHIALALKAAQEGITLLKNDWGPGAPGPVLPFKREAVKTIAVIGKLGEKPNIGDYGSSRVFPRYVVSPVEGIRRAAPDARVIFDDGSDIDRAKKAAASADAVVFVVGFDHGDEGEYVAGEGADNYTEAIGGDRKTLNLHDDEIALINAAGPQNKNSAAVIIGGNTTMITGWMDKIGGIVMAYYPGQEGGTAIAQILFGDINPSGKLPYVQPVRETDLPQLNWDTTNQWYDYYHGYAKLEKEGKQPLYPYGFGLSYTTFKAAEPQFGVSGGAVTASCTVTNTGNRRGTEVVQLYIGFSHSSVDRPVKLLRGFARVELDPGQSRAVDLRCPLEKLEWYNPRSPGFEFEHMEYDVYIGTSSADKDLLKGSVKL